MKTIFAIVMCISCSVIFTSKADAFWVWTPKTNKFVNPKKAAKDTPEGQFKWAMRFFKDKDYKRAAEEFASLTAQFKDSHLAPEAQYYVGRAYEAAGKYYPAFQAYQKTVGAYPFTERIDEIIRREYDIGIVLYRKHRGTFMGKEIMTDLDRAVEIFDKVKNNAPFGEYAAKAQFMIGECYKKSEQYDQAAEAYQKMLDEYPKSVFAVKAKYEAAQAVYLASLKSDYDQERTDLAIKEFKEVAKDYKGLPVSNEASVAIALLEDRKAESLFKTAKFYESQKHYKSAAIYYREILVSYPRGSFGESAREHLSSIEGFLKD
ncbi:MAG: outer membrane protein assembly factor BamD [Omnitrophica bacterium]|nr:outer membrane protein assembly factor BamD [Candidatus Omnitrophota bacterium]